MRTARTAAVHPLDDLERGKFTRKASFGDGGEEEIVRPISSHASLSAELVEAVMYDGQYRFTSEKAQEVAMWCGLVSFVVAGCGMVGVGLFIALSH